MYILYIYAVYINILLIDNYVRTTTLATCKSYYSIYILLLLLYLLFFNKIIEINKLNKNYNYNYVFKRIYKLIINKKKNEIIFCL